MSVKLFVLSKGEGNGGEEAGAVLTVELGYAFSEWLDRGVTQTRLE